MAILQRRIPGHITDKNYHEKFSILQLRGTETKEI